MRRFLRPILVVVAVLTISAITLWAQRDNPAWVTRQWLNAAVAGDDRRVQYHTCQRILDETQRASGILGSVNSFDGFSVGDMTVSFDIGVDTDVSGVRYRTVEEREQRAVVQLDGNVTMNVVGIARDVPLTIDVPLIREDNRWKICV
jgi:hypothetical protein